MKPWALVLMPTGRRWHVVGSFGDAPRDRKATTVRTACGRFTWLAPREPVDPGDLDEGALTCKHCHRAVVAQADWYFELAEEIGRHT